jgi:hypothetical protein
MAYPGITDLPSVLLYLGGCVLVMACAGCHTHTHTRHPSSTSHHTTHHTIGARWVQDLGGLDVLPTLPPALTTAAAAAGATTTATTTPALTPEQRAASSLEGLAALRRQQRAAVVLERLQSAKLAALALKWVPGLGRAGQGRAHRPQGVGRRQHGSGSGWGKQQQQQQEGCGTGSRCTGEAPNCTCAPPSTGGARAAWGACVQGGGVGAGHPWGCCYLLALQPHLRSASC